MHSKFHDVINAYSQGGQFRDVLDKYFFDAFCPDDADYILRSLELTAPLISPYAESFWDQVAIAREEGWGFVDDYTMTAINETLAEIASLRHIGDERVPEEWNDLYDVIIRCYEELTREDDASSQGPESIVLDP